MDFFAETYTPRAIYRERPEERRADPPEMGGENPEWLRVRNKILAALLRFPEAFEAVKEALRAPEPQT
jgi:hypothetical protein